MTPPDQHYGISIIVCCYNSANRLPETIRHLAQQVIPQNMGFEVLLVNNASTDNTVQEATRLWADHPGDPASFRIVHEARPGQNHARRKGVESAIHPFVVFCDDDNWLHRDYAQTACKRLAGDNTIGAVAGQNHPVTDAAQYPDWWPAYQDKYALGTPAATSGDISERGFVLGAGMATRRQLFLDMYPPEHPTLLKGRSGTALSTGDDFEYCKRLLLRGYSLFYEENMKLQHFIPHERLTIAYRDRLMAGILDAGTIISQYDDAVKTFRRNGKKNRMRLFLLTPFRIALVKLGLSNRRLEDEALALYYASPFPGSNPVKAAIKKFMYAKNNQHDH